MQEFTGLEYIKIAAANEFGMDKLSWKDRIFWFDYNERDLFSLVDQAANKFLYTKAINAYQDAVNGVPTGYIMSLDATASGLQIMACLSGCLKTAAAVNLIDTGDREDVYTEVATGMNLILDPVDAVVRADVKKPVMTHYYNKSRQGSLRGERENAFHEVLNSLFSGAEDVMNLINECWDNSALYHKWVTPDGHVSKVKVTEAMDTRIEVDELDHTTFTYRYTSNQPSTRHTSLCPNYIHSLDAWVARMMVRMAHKQGFQLAHIHDSFWASPNHMNKVRNNYRVILAKLADSDALNKFMLDVTGNNVLLIKDSADLSKHILNSEYALS